MKPCAMNRKLYKGNQAIIGMMLPQNKEVKHPVKQRADRHYHGTHVNQSADVLEIVLIHGSVGCCEVQQVVITSFSALQLGLLYFPLPLQNTHTQRKQRVTDMN